VTTATVSTAGAEPGFEERLRSSVKATDFAWKMADVKGLAVMDARSINRKLE